MVVESKRGNYSFVKGISPYSAGVTASPGYEIEHVRLAQMPPWRAGFDRIAARLAELGRPKQALCAIALRSPKPFTFGGFNSFNGDYVKLLESWQIPFDGLNPVARTNVAPEMDPPAEPSLYSFAYTVPSKAPRRSFVVAGAGELPEGSLDPHDVVRRGEVSPDALVEKARFVMGLMTGRLQGLGADWGQVTVVNVYTVHNLGLLLRQELLAKMGKAKQAGVTWHLTRPPIESIEFEMDLRAVAREVVL